MEHINDIKLLDFVGGRILGAESEQVRRHIAECTVCASRHKESLATWETLGEWRIDSADHHVAGHIETLSAQTKLQQHPERKVLIPLRSSLIAALRIAAAIIIATVGGHLLGRYSSAPNENIAIISTDKPHYLAALDFEWSSELTWTVLEEDTAGVIRQ